MKLTKSKLKQIIKAEIATLSEGDWDVSKRTAFPRVISQILSALRETQEIIEGGHLDEDVPISDITIESIKEVFNHPMLDKLKELAGIETPAEDIEASDFVRGETHGEATARMAKPVKLDSPWSEE